MEEDDYQTALALQIANNQGFVDAAAQSGFNAGLEAAQASRAAEQ